MPSEIQQESLQPTESTVLDPHPLPNLKERPGFGGDSGFEGGLKESNFGFVNRDGSSTTSYDHYNPWDHEDREPIQ
jgi:hypothetical protein